MPPASRRDSNAAPDALGVPVSPFARALFFAGALLLFVVLWLDYRDYWLDDAFITFRYALHLAEGLGPVFNAGERVEGYTSFLWMLIAALPLAVLDVAASLEAYKAFALLCSAWVLFRVYRFPTPDGETVPRWFVLVLASQPVFVLNCGDGMETPLLSVLMLELCLALQRTPTRSAGVGSGLLVAALVWTRPESLPLLVAVPVLGVLANRRDALALRGWLMGFALAALLPVVAHELFRFFYYGALFPNTFYAKATGDLVVRLGRGFDDVGRFFFINPWSLPVALWVLAGLAGWGTWRAVPALREGDGRALRWYGALWLMVLFRLSFDLWSGSDTMGRHRFLAPLIVPLAILADEGARRISSVRGRGMVAAAAVLAVGFNVSAHAVHVESTRPYIEGLERGHIALGQWLRESQPPDSLIAVADAGAIPFFSRLEAVDLWGLNDATIARLPGEYGERPGMVDYVMERDPDLIVLWNQRSFLATGAQGRPEGRLLGGQALDHAIASDPRFGARYRFTREFVFREQRSELAGYYLDVFVRRASRSDPSPRPPRSASPRTIRSARPREARPSA